MTFRIGQVIELVVDEKKTASKLEGFERVDGGVVLHVFVNEADL